MYEHEKYDRKQRDDDEYRPSFPKVNEKYWDMFASYLADRDLSPYLARANGWYPATYHGAARIIIPCSNAAGIPYWQGREMTGKHELRYASPYVARDDSLVLVWPDDEGQRKGGAVFEGPMDALAAAELGFAGVALMGNTPTDSVLDHLCSFARAFAPVVIVPDADALHFGAVVLSSLAQRGIAAMIRTPGKKDLAEMTVKERREFLNVL